MAYAINDAMVCPHMTESLEYASAIHHIYAFCSFHFCFFIIILSCDREPNNWFNLF